MNISILLFEDFETLDVFGPVGIFGHLADKPQIFFYSLAGGMVGNAHGVSIATQKAELLDDGADILLIPGGKGTRGLIDNEEFTGLVRRVGSACNFVLTVCTGSALLAKTGLLDGREATSNKRAFGWVTGISNRVSWKKHARWTVDGKYYTSAGVTAGMDMALGFIADQYGAPQAHEIARHIEYTWIEDPNDDRFSDQE